MKNEIKILLFIVIFLILTSFVIISLYRTYCEKSDLLTEDAQELFLEAIQLDMDRRFQEQGSDLRFSYAPVFNRDIITIESADSTIYIKNDKEAARKMSNSEKIDFSIQLFLLYTSPINVTSLDSLFQTLLLQKQISAFTAITYTLNDKSVSSSDDSTFFQSAIALDEITFGPVRTIVLQAFVKFPFYSVFRQAVFSNGLFVLVWIIMLFVFIWFIFSRRGQKIQIIPIPEVPKNIIEIIPGLLFDEIHGVLYTKDQQVTLINIRLKLFLVLLEHREHYIDTDKLMELIWAERNATKDALSTAVKRLKQDLLPIPELVIESARNKGYVLRIRDSVT